MTKTAAEVEREVELSRAELDRTVEAIKDKMTPGQLFDEASRTLGTAGQQVLSKFVEQAKENPMPLAVMGVGLAWLMSSNRHPRVSGDGSPDYRQAYESRSFAPDEGRFREGVSDKLHAAGERAAEALASGKDAITGEAASAAHKLHDATQGAANKAADYGHRAQQGLTELFEREPLLLGALGAVVGAALGAAIPPTETEDRILGSTRDKVVDKGLALAEQGFSTVQDMAEAAYTGVKDELRPSEGDERDLAQRVKDAAGAAIDEGRLHLGGAAPQ